MKETLVYPDAKSLSQFLIHSKSGKVVPLSPLRDGQGLVLSLCQEKWLEAGEPAWLDIYKSIESGIQTLAMALVAWNLTQKDLISVVACPAKPIARYYEQVVSDMLNGKAMQCKKDGILAIGNSFATFSTYDKVPKFIKGKPIHGIVCIDSDYLNYDEEAKFVAKYKLAFPLRPPCFCLKINQRNISNRWPASFLRVEI